MPYLESPEAEEQPHSDLMTTFKQQAAPGTVTETYETDTGLTGPMGMNPLCIRVAISQLPCSAMNGSNITATLFIDDKNPWTQADAFMKDLATKGLSARLDHAIPEMSVPMRLSITGADMVEKVFDELRTAYEPSQQDGAIIELPIVHPHLLGTVREKIEEWVQIQKGQPPRAGGWAELSPYGWRP